MNPKVSNTRKTNLIGYLYTFLLMCEYVYVQYNTLVNTLGLKNRQDFE